MLGTPLMILDNDARFRRVRFVTGSSARPEAYRAEGKPAERTLVGSLVITNILVVFAGSGDAFACSHPFAGVGISEVQHFECISEKSPLHPHPRPPILGTGTVVKPKTDKADARIAPRVVASGTERHYATVNTEEAPGVK